jgi:hypothetical protein
MNITTRDAIDELTYVSYSTQRERRPDVEPSRWGSIFSDWARFETRYQVSLSCAVRATNVLQS